MDGLNALGVSPRDMITTYLLIMHQRYDVSSRNARQELLVHHLAAATTLVQAGDAQRLHELGREFIEWVDEGES